MYLSVWTSEVVRARSGRLALQWSRSWDHGSFHVITLVTDDGVTPVYARALWRIGEHGGGNLVVPLPSGANDKQARLLCDRFVAGRLHLEVPSPAEEDEV